jgi:hypothetical protein
VQAANGSVTSARIFLMERGIEFLRLVGDRVFSFARVSYFQSRARPRHIQLGARVSAVRHGGKRSVRPSAPLPEVTTTSLTARL